MTYRDLKSANILLNQILQANLADFGLSRIFSSESDTHVTTAVAGTAGYLDPEYVFNMKLNFSIFLSCHSIKVSQIIAILFLIDIYSVKYTTGIVVYNLGWKYFEHVDTMYESSINYAWWTLLQTKYSFTRKSSNSTSFVFN